MNMTPRATDSHGLSAYPDLPAKPNCKYQVIDMSKLNDLLAFCDNNLTAHFRIVPRDMSRMQEWIATRGLSTHSFTQELLHAIVSQHKT